jgi:hypothetical protein
MRLFCPTAQSISAFPQMAISHHLQACDFNHLATVHGVVFRVFCLTGGEWRSSGASDA